MADPLALVDLVRSGVPWQIYRGVVENLGLNDRAAAGILHIPPRTLARRKGGRLEPNEGERLVRLVRLAAHATDVLGSREKALRWMEAPNRALAGATPMSLLDTDIGTQEAEAVLTRIEYGVFS
jgi:putative toxin-antitoxin system antitoxin component (TIGR02293 family)